MDFIIRSATPEDFPAIGEVTVQVYRELLPARPESQDYLARMADVEERAGTTELLVAADPVGGEVLGAVTFARPGTPYAHLAGPGEGEFRLLAVAPAARGRGIGEGLVRACMDRARELDLPRMVLGTGPDMSAAHRLYLRLGFVRTPARDIEPVPGVQLWTFAAELDEARRQPTAA